MCGIVGIHGTGPVNQPLYDALTVLQHRGQDAAGIVTSDGARLSLRKANGLVRDVFQQVHMERLQGHHGIGHVRYPTAGSSSVAEAQPMYVNSPYGIALAHNGNLTNAEALKDAMFRADLRHINTDSDSEILLNVFAHELAQRAKDLPSSPEDIFAAVSAVHERCRGAYAVVMLIMGRGLLAFRDPYGIRPLVFGHRETAGGQETMVASESVALDVLDFSLVRDVARGRRSLWISWARFIRGSVQRHRAVRRASSSTFIFPAPTPSWTTFPSTRRACAWVSVWPNAFWRPSPRGMILTW